MLTKRFLFTVLLILFTAGISFAQKDRRGPDSFKNMEPSDMAEATVQKMTKELDLTSEQQQKLTEIFTNHYAEMKDLRDSFKDDSDEFQTIVNMQKENLNRVVKDILTEDQYEEWEDMQSEMESNREKRNGKRGFK